MAAAQTRLDIAAENVSNAGSTGFTRLAATGSIGPNGVAIAATPTHQRVDTVTEMIDVLGAQRAFESAAKVATTIDEARKQSNDAARVR